jgi:aminoglycoside phosphotransferase (APT) family kinase protein
VEDGEIGSALGEVLGGRVSGLSRLSGGASRASYAFEAGGAAFVLRLGTPGGLAGGAPVTREALLMRAAAAAGVPTPEVVASGGADGVFGADFVIMRRVAGETIPRRILRDDAYARVRAGLAGQCGTVLAAVHQIPVDAVAGLEGGDPLEVWPALLDATGEPHPVLELALRRLALDRPPAGRTAVVHGDFRNGNLIVGADGIRAVLDWELSHLGDPLEDLGWLCVKAWRFGSDLPVGGFGDYDALIAGYEAAGGDPVDRAALAWWEILGVVKWGILCVMQARRHLSGGERSVELAALGRRVAENEWDLLQML